MNKNYFEAESCFEKGEYRKSYTLFKTIAENEELSHKLRSDAFCMMGVLILFDPENDIEDESGITYFFRAAQLDPQNIGALFNIIENFGTSPNSHNNIIAFDFALEQLQKLNYKFSSRDFDVIERKKKLRNSK